MNLMPSPPLAARERDDDVPAALAPGQSARICVAGSGAVGGTLAVRLARAGHDVSVIARGSHLAAIQSSGLRLHHANEDIVGKVRAADHAAFGVQDVIFVSVKAHGLATMLPMIAPMIGPQTIVVPTINGIPWWYFQSEGGRFDGERILAVDPDGALQKALPLHNLVGCVVYIAAEVTGPGEIVTTNASRLTLGEPSNQRSSRVDALCALLEKAGIKAEASDRIRAALWTKLMANLATNPLSVVAGTTFDVVGADPEMRRLVETLMSETLQVGRACGAGLDVEVSKVMGMVDRLGAFKTSMLQDFEKGHPLELAAIGDAVVELAERCDVQIPTIRMILALARFRSAQSCVTL